MKTRKPRARRTSNEGARPAGSALKHAAQVRAGKAEEVSVRSGTRIPSSGRVPAKWRWYNRALLELRSRCLGERGDLLRAAAEPLEPHSLDEADSATDELDHNLALSELSNRQDAIYEIDEALRRIRNGTYGVCLETGKPISAARLRAVPWARFTREVEARLERGGLVHRPRLGALGSARGVVKGFGEAGETEEEAESAQSGEETLHLIPLPPPSRRSPKTKPKPQTPTR